MEQKGQGLSLRAGLAFVIGMWLGVELLTYLAKQDQQEDKMSRPQQLIQERYHENTNQKPIFTTGRTNLESNLDHYKR